MPDVIPGGVMGDLIKHVLGQGYQGRKEPHKRRSVHMLNGF